MRLASRPSPQPTLSEAKSPLRLARTQIVEEVAHPDVALVERDDVAGRLLAAVEVFPGQPYLDRLASRPGRRFGDDELDDVGNPAAARAPRTQEVLNRTDALLRREDVDVHRRDVRPRLLGRRVLSELHERALHELAAGLARPELLLDLGEFLLDAGDDLLGALQRRALRHQDARDHDVGLDRRHALERETPAGEHGDRQEEDADDAAEREIAPPQQQVDAAPDDVLAHPREARVEPAPEPTRLGLVVQRMRQVRGQDEERLDEADGQDEQQHDRDDLERAADLTGEKRQRTEDAGGREERRKDADLHFADAQPRRLQRALAPRCGGARCSPR